MSITTQATTFFKDDVTQFADSEFGSQFNSALSRDPRVNPEIASYLDCGSFCDNAQYISECVGIGYQSRREYLPIHGSCHSRYSSESCSSTTESSSCSISSMRNKIEYCVIEAHSSGSEDSQMPEEEEESQSPMSQDVEDILQTFLASDNDLLEIPLIAEDSIGRTTSRGLGASLRKRVGGMLKGVTNCVSKLHAVWDWPLDKSIDIINEVGTWMEDNREHVETTVWSCQTCPELQKDIKRIVDEQKNVNDLLKAAIEKIATTLDSVTSMNAKNFTFIEKEIESLKAGAGNTKDMELLGRLNLLESKISTGAGMSNEDSSRLSGVVYKMNTLVDEVARLQAKLKMDPPRVRPVPANVGEQLSVAKQAARPSRKPQLAGEEDLSDFPYEFQVNRNKSMVSGDVLVEQVRKQADDVQIASEEVQVTKVPTSVVKSEGTTEEHNVMRAKLYLGSVSWNVTDGEGSVIKNFSLPSDLWARNARLKSILSCFQYYTCEGLTFYVTTTSVGMQGGTLMVNWDALSCATRQNIDSVLQLSNLPSAFIQASSSVEQIFSVDSPCIQHIMCTSSSEGSIGNLGTFKISVVNVLNAAAETSQQVQVNVWVQFKNPVISFYTVPHDLVVAQADVATLSSLNGIESFEAIIAMDKWSTTSATNLMEITVHPTACNVAKGLVTQTSLSIISSLFARWSGSLKYRIVFGASMFVKGKLVMSAIPVAFRDSKMSIDQITSFPCVVCDLSGDIRDFELEVPYISVGKDSLVNRDSLYDISSYNAELVVSRLHLVIMDPLVMNANASNNISFFVTVRPGNDFQLKHLCGVKSEYVDRTLKHGFGKSLKCTGLMGKGFSEWCQIPSILWKFSLDSESKNALHFMVAPSYRSTPPGTTSLCWLAQIFVQWSGTLIYTIRAHSHERMFSSFVRVWYDPNGSTQSGSESEFLSDVDPPAGVKVFYWRPYEQPKLEIRVPFCARTEKLLIPKTRYPLAPFDWLHYYNGSLIIDYEGVKKMKLEMTISAGEDFEMYEQTVAPRSGRVSAAFTSFSYEKKLVDVTKFPHNKTRLEGPANRAKITPNKFIPVPSVESAYGSNDYVPDNDTEEERSSSSGVATVPKYKKPKEGEKGITDVGEPIIYRHGQWEYIDDDVRAHAGCLPNFGAKEIRDAVHHLEMRHTCAKVADIVDKSHETLFGGNVKMDRFLEATQTIVPLLESAKRITGSMEEKMAQIDSYKDKILKVLGSLFAGSLPGLIDSAVQNDKYVWATIVTLLGGTSLLWVCKSKKSYIKKLSLLCMIIWSPFIANSVWQFGAWIKRNAFSMMHRTYEDETCRKHSMAGAFEGVSGAFGNFAEWFSENWAVAVQSLLSILGVVASLVVWGTIPDEKKLSSFAAKFKAVGEKGRSFTNIFSGFSSINKMSSEWSKQLVSWIMSVAGSGLPKADSALQVILDFDLKQWVVDVREMSLQENRFKGFGGEQHLFKVRQLYDNSEKIQAAILNGCKVDVQLAFIIRECKEKCTELLNESYSFKGMKKPRVDPIHICMLGRPGVGKSALTHVMINNLLDHRCEPAVDRVYTRCCADAYWSNYHQEPVVLYDDLGAIKSSLKMSDYAEIMGIKTNDPFSVPMAGVEDKGKHCTSRYVFSCTNVREIDDSGDVVTKLAYYRRRNILVEVEKDPDVERDESNPTKGLLFTVLGYILGGSNGDKVSFEVKDTWDECFLRHVDTTDWRFERVGYKVFLRFLCIYTDAYMASQEKLLQGITTFKMDPFEEDEVEAQAGYTTVTLQEAISKFDALKVSGESFASLYKGSKYRPPETWNTRKELTFAQLMAGLCGCASGKHCEFDLHFKQYNCLVGKLNCYENFVLDKVHQIPDLTTIKLKREGDYFDNLQTTAIFSSLATMFKWSFHGEICYYHYMLRKSHAEKEFKDGESEVYIEDKLFILGRTSDIIVWPSCGKYFPGILSKYGCVPLFIKDSYVFLVPSSSSSVDRELAKRGWKYVWTSGVNSKVDLVQLFANEDQDVVRQMVEMVHTFGTFDSISDLVVETVGLAGENFLDQFAKVRMMLVMCQKSSERLKIDEQEGLFRQTTRRDPVSRRFEEYEKKMASELSGKAKLALAVGAGVVASGILVAVIVGIKSLFKAMSGKEDEGIEDAMAELSGSHESDMFQTKRIIQVRKPRPKVVVSSLEPQLSQASESDQFVTKHIKQRPWFARSRPERGFGVTYDDGVDMNRQLYLEKRKNFRRQVQTAVKHASAPIVSAAAPDLISKISQWQIKVQNFGVLPAPTARNSVLIEIGKCNMMSSKQASNGELLVGNPDFVVDQEIQDLLGKVIHLDVADGPALVADGTYYQVQKQAQVGSFGLDRDANMVNMLQTHVSKMSCTILRSRGGVFTTYGVLRLKGTIILAPAHYLDDFQSDDELYFLCPNKVVRIGYETKRISLVSDLQDLVVWDLGNVVPPSVDYTSHIATADDWKSFRKCSGVLSMTKYSQNMTMQIVHTLDAIEMTSADVEVPTGAYEIYGTTHTVLSGLRYRVHCMPGFCGSAIVRADTRAVRKIIGMHVAGQKSKGVGYAETLTLEPILQAVSNLRQCIVSKSLVEKKPQMCEKQSVSFENKGNLGILGQVQMREVPTVTTKTTIAPSVIHGMIGRIETEPSILNAYDKRLGKLRCSWNPVLEAVKKYGTPTKPFRHDEIEEVRHHLTSVFSRKENSLRKREVNSLEVGINGIDLSDFWSPIEMKTSAGYPYVLRKGSGATGKKWLFEEVGTYPSGRVKYVVKDEGLKLSLDQMMKQISSGEVPSFISLDCPKDERRKLSKIYENPATRTFTILPPEINILFRMYFGDFAAMVMSNRFDSFSQVGINPETMEWSELMNSFLRKGAKGFAGDYAKFDGIGSADIYHSIGDVVNAWYDDGPANARARHCLISSIVHRDGLATDLLLRYSQGMPSGFAMTVIFNSFVNYYYMALAWMHIVSKSMLSPQADLDSFDVYTRLVVYGDDNVVAVADEFLDIYNLRTVASYLSEYGITYTDDAKNPIHLSEPYGDITKVTFLKRSFVKVVNSSVLWKAPLAKVSIEERCNWIRECEVPVEAVYQNFDSALFEASIHGESYFDDLKSRINEALARVVLDPVSVTYRQSVNRWWMEMTGGVMSPVEATKLVQVMGKGSVDLEYRFRDMFLDKDTTLGEALERCKYAPLMSFIP